MHDLNSCDEFDFLMINACGFLNFDPMKKSLMFAMICVPFLFSCEEDDPCNSVDCFNGGNCVDGVCDCPPGYSGVNCENFDECFGVECLNGGICANGICDCQPGYSGTLCEDFDPCFDVTCENGGTCVDGECDCPPNYEGENCENQITPSSVNITSVQVTQFPLLNNSGMPWDENDNPDLFVELSYGGNVLYTSDPIASNANQGGITLWTPGSAVMKDDVFDEYTVTLFDDDNGLPPQTMGSIDFIPYSIDNDFPTQFELSADSVTVKLQVEYNF